MTSTSLVEGANDRAVALAPALRLGHVYRMPSARRLYIVIFGISFAALLLEISYTRLVSFKLFYYYTYLIIGFAMLGIGAGGVLVAVLPRLRSVALPRLLVLGCTLGALAIGAGYFVIALTPLTTRLVWAPGGGAE